MNQFFLSFSSFIFILFFSTFHFKSTSRKKEKDKRKLEWKRSFLVDDSFSLPFHLLFHANSYRLCLSISKSFGQSYFSSLFIDFPFPFSFLFFNFAFSFLLSRSGIVFTFVVFLFFLVKHMNSSCLCDSSFFFSKLGIACLFSFCISFSHSFSSGSTFQLLEFIWHLHSFPILISYGFSLSISFTNS